MQTVKYNKTTSIWLTEEVKNFYQKEAARRGIKPSELMREALRQYKNKIENQSEKCQ